MGDTGTPAGWHQDPLDHRAVRYWDGQDWTERVRPKGAPPISDAVPGATPDPHSWPSASGEQHVALSDKAGFWRRAGALAIDFFGSSFLVALTTLPVLLYSDTESRGVVAWLLIGVFYWPICEGLVGQTLGKRLLGVTVVRFDTREEPIGLKRAFGRHAGRLLNNFVLGAGWLVAAFSRNGRGWHDQVSNTQAVRAYERRSWPAPARNAMIAVVAAASLIDMAAWAVMPTTASHELLTLRSEINDAITRWNCLHDYTGPARDGEWSLIASRRLSGAVAGAALHGFRGSERDVADMGIGVGRDMLDALAGYAWDYRDLNQRLFLFRAAVAEREGAPDEVVEELLAGAFDPSPSNSSTSALTYCRRLFESGV